MLDKQKLFFYWKVPNNTKLIYSIISVQPWNYAYFFTYYILQGIKHNTYIGIYMPMSGT